MAKKKVKAPNKIKKTERKPISAYHHSQSSRPTAFVLGDELEYRIQRLLIYMGYFVRRGKPIFTVANLDRATDLDALAIRFVEPFNREMLIAECKSGDAGPLDRIFWLSGLRNYVQAKEAILVRKGTKWNIKEFAKQCSVKIIDLFRIEELESLYKINTKEWPGLSDIEFIKTEIDNWNDVLKNDQTIWEILATLHSEIRFHDPFPAINYLLSQMRRISRSYSEYSDKSFYRYIIAECLSHLLIFCMCVAEMSYDLKKDDREGFIRKGLKYGSFEPRFAERILESAYNLTRQAVMHYTSREVEIDKSLFEMPEIPGTDAIITIIEGIHTAYPRSLNMPQICDLLLSELFTKKYKAKGIIKTIFPYQGMVNRIELIKWYLQILIDYEACPADVIDSITSQISDKENNITPKLKDDAAQNIKGITQSSLFNTPNIKDEQLK